MSKQNNMESCTQLLAQFNIRAKRIKISYFIESKNEKAKDLFINLLLNKISKCFFYISY